MKLVINDLALGCPINPQREWRGVHGCEAFYAISNDGFVVSLERKCSTGHHERTVRQRLLKRHEVYNRAEKLVSLVVKLSMGPNAPARHASIAKLMLESFVGPRDGMIASTMDRDPSNLALENLEWTTFSAIGTNAVKGGYGKTKRAVTGSFST
jgi:hypothetical protein